MKPLKQSGARHDPDAKVVADCRARAVKALVSGLGSPAPEVRAASALALGRMSESGAVGPLSALAANDAGPKVRQVALLALGLADLPETRDFLLTYRYPTDQLMEAGCVGLGLLSAADDPRIVTVLQGALGSSKPGLAIIGAWGLRQRTDPECLKALKNVLAQSKSPWLASEAILALGERTEAESLPVLTDILLGTEQAESVAAYRALVDCNTEIARAIADAGAAVQQNEPLKTLYRKTRQWRDLGPNGQAGTAPATAVIRVGVEKAYLATLRTSAAIALGHYRNPAATEALVDSLSLRDDGYTRTFKGPAMMSLGEIGDPACLPPLMEHLGRTQPSGKPKSAADMGSPLRGYAALALGLYSRPRSAPLPAGDPPDYDKVCQALGERLADTSEELEVRTACAMGLGLTARTENLPRLQKASETVGPADDLLAGYLLLARAMLGDRNIIAPARKFLDAAGEKKDTAAVLSRRAAVLGLALTDLPDALPAPLEAWRMTHYVNREAAVALGLRAAYDATEPLARLLETSPDPAEQAFAARCLGELFLAQRPDRLCRLVNGSNYTLRNDRMAAYQAAANEFLYEYLLPCFADEWP